MLDKTILKQKEILLNYWKREGIATDRIIRAFDKVPREAFVPKALKHQAYDDHPLPIGYGQTISQPTTVAIMTQALNPMPNEKVLEIGTGSGYQAAIIAELVKPGIVVTTEILPELSKNASKTLKKLGFKNVKVITTDGSIGYAKEAPYDKIIVTSASPRINKYWIEQLKTGGVLIAPVGSLTEQELLRVVKTRHGLKTQNLGSFVFVPLRGKQGWFE